MSQDQPSPNLPANPIKSPISLEEVAKIPLPGMAIPGDLAFSPDDRLATFLYSPEGNLTRKLFGYNLQTGELKIFAAPDLPGVTEENVSLEEALLRERMRQMETGVTKYAWAKHGQRILIPLQGALYICDEPFQPWRCLVQATPGQPILEARFSPDGQWVSYVQDAELHLLPVAGGQPRQLTFGAREAGKTHGLAEYIAQEEMHRREGAWWSPNSRWLAFTEVDESHIPVYRILHQGKDALGEAAQEDHRYPFAGQPNAKVRLGVISIEGGEPVWMDLGKDEDIYLARVHWLPDGRLAAQIQNRQQTQLDLMVFDLQTGQGQLLLRETSPIWINLHDIFRPLQQPYEEQSGLLIWASERTGYRHLYLLDAGGNVLRPLTSGEWMVDALVGVDEKNERVYFTATLESPLESHLYVITFSGGRPQRLTQEPGMHQVVIDHTCQTFLDTRHALDKPPAVTLRSLKDGELLATIFEPLDPRLEIFSLPVPELVSLKNRHGDMLYGMVYRPPASFGEGPFPTVVHIYGGPGSQQVANSWGYTVRMRAQYLASLGFLVFALDNRGSARRGLLFEGAIQGDMGQYEVEDQVDGVRWLVEQGLADAQRVGIYGWSYGGYMAAMCLARAPETFRAAVAGAPVTAWDGYDTHYTERYMGLPQRNPEGYQNSSVMSHVKNMTGKLMLVHGLIDENVHFRHTARLINALIAARKNYDLLLFPDERHSPRKLADRVYMEQRICDFFLQNL
jgi:dipeptidyl-peptidase-4